MTHMDPLSDPSRKPAPRVCGVCREVVDLWAWDDGASRPGDVPSGFFDDRGEWVWDEVETAHPPYMEFVCSWQCAARAHW